jgi:hypothetical protein
MPPAPSAPPPSYLGFDANAYPGDENLPALKRRFSFAGYWLNIPPGAKTNSWAGNRALLQQRGFGFLVLFNGKLERELKSIAHASVLGSSDADSSANAAAAEGFPSGTIIFLDQEEGGRMEGDQLAYLIAWIDGVKARGFRPGIYCSGIPANEGRGQFAVTANDISSHLAGRQVAFFVHNDACPPAPGCRIDMAPQPADSGVGFASVWQFAQSPQRKELTARCTVPYSRDGNCYAPGDAAASGTIDLDAATSPDPSIGRRLPRRAAENIAENR